MLDICIERRSVTRTLWQRSRRAGARTRVCFGASNEIRTRRSPDRQSGSTPGVEALKWLPPEGVEPDSDTLTAWRIALMLDGKNGAG